ncbi:MAG: tRNA (adenosine(37)-N6)-dimethylallyltransferase MiaA [Sphingobacteriaceae bacterium]|nr:tRNA (adenosine(37)-N6)-dimethylallyltransferase MiaA [Sphingobacteriaceae bacterium]
MQKNLIVIVGPTAIGKTALAIKIATKYKTEIISADSRQFFKEMSIGTAKPSNEELSAVKHHFINSHSIHDYFSNGDFEIKALKTIEKLFETHNTVVMVGGSGLYVDALCNGLDILPEIDFNIREKLNLQLQQEGIESIKKQLEMVDPEYFSKVDQNNPQRMIRGLEVFLSTGNKISTYLTNTKKKRSFNILKIALNTERSVLYQQINQRVDMMMKEGLLNEVKNLSAHRNTYALKTVGYSEIFEHLDGNISLETAVENIKQNTRRFAKRQITWFKKDLQTKWFEPTHYDEIIAYLEAKI